MTASRHQEDLLCLQDLSLFKNVHPVYCSGSCRVGALVALTVAEVSDFGFSPDVVEVIISIKTYKDRLHNVSVLSDGCYPTLSVQLGYAANTTTVITATKAT